ncbi:MAG: T9SS type A sorting domain-containing protein, partial [Bacteroidota bacterium]|nr:T9SS type A sorting domain-containing protein [Bacteroidota bacterium]
RSINGGRNWRSAFYPMGGERLAAVRGLAGSEVVWIASDRAAWVSPNAGGSWTETVTIPVGPVQDAVFADSARGWIVSKAGIVQRLVSNPLLDASSLAFTAATGMDIRGVYPNPARSTNASVTVLLRLQRPGAVRLVVYNSAGAEVAVPLAQHLPAGRHQTVFRTAGLTPGAYFLSLTAGTEQVVRRMIIAR